MAAKFESRQAKKGCKYYVVFVYSSSSTKYMLVIDDHFFQHCCTDWAIIAIVFLVPRAKYLKA
jgi:hypothetical protein